MEGIRKRLKEEIKNSGLTQKEIAKKIGVNQSNISDYINNKSLPALDTFAKLCRLLELDANYILGITDEYGKKNEEK